jgi:DNA-binding XRE family transcriptional regulator
MYLSGHTQQEIADAVGVDKATVNRRLEECCNLDKCPKSNKIAALFEDDFKAPLYNVWRFTKSSNNVAHFGESEQTIVENLLYLYTAPFDLVVDPFAGGGSTIDICKKRLRRVWASDRKPIPERENDIRKHDIVTDGIPPLNNRWSDVSLTYLDPPYWKQAEGQYSNDAEDLANQSIEDFTRNLSNLVIEVGKRQSKGVIALLIQPTQWRSPDRKFTDHVFDVIRAVQDSGVNLELVNRVSCPYNSEQYNPQMVNVAKDEKLLLVLTRELIVWRCGV